MRQPRPLPSLTGWLRRQTRSTSLASRVATPTPTADTSGVTIGVTADAASVTRLSFEVKHWVRGRLRIVVPRIATDAEYRDRLVYAIGGTSSGFVVRVNPHARSVVVEYDPQVHTDADVLDRLVISIKRADADDELPPPEERAATAPASDHRIDYLTRLGPAGLSMTMVAGTFAGVAVPPLLMGAAIIAAAIPSYRRAARTLRHERKLNVDFLDSTAITALTITGSFFPPALMITLIETGEIIRDLTARRSARARLNLLDSLGRTARVERDGVQVEVPLEQVQIGDVVVVYPGDQIPVDGEVVGGVGLIDQHKLTGESVPVTREAGQDVLAATIVVEGTLRIATKRTGADTRAGMVVALMDSAPVHDTRMEDYARKVGDRVVIPTLALGAATTVMSGGNLVRGASVITFDVGTGVRVSVPTTVLASLTFAARNGILMRSGRGLEQMAGVDAVIFDKTGTLTQGRAGVVGIFTRSADVEALDVLRLAATAEQGLTHPVAEAVVRHAREQEVVCGDCEEWEYLVGKGVTARIDGATIHVGSHRMMSGLGIDTDRLLAEHPEIVAGGASQVYVARDQELLGIILYKDPARPESAAVVRRLKEMGITPYMLSGDIQAVANAMAAEVGIPPENVYAEAFPERKVEVVKQLQEQGARVAFVGDGINDSAALAYASASVSFAGASDIAREVADVVLMDDNLLSLIGCLQVSRHAMTIIRQNTAVVVGPNLTGVVWATLMPVSPLIAVLINNGSAIAAEMNGFRPLSGPPGWSALAEERERIAAGARRVVSPPDTLPDPVETAPTNGHRPGLRLKAVGRKRSNGTGGATPTVIEVEPRGVPV